MSTIAIIDDDMNQLAGLAAAFRQEGYEVDAYCDPVVALPKVILVPPDLLILNGHMPGMHGIEFFMTFRQFSKAPVLLLSASADEIEDKLLEMGVSADACLGKPFSINGVKRYAELLTSIARRRMNRSST